MILLDSDEGRVLIIETIAQRNALVWENNPGIIIASSGMLAGGPSLSYARALAGKPEHAILLTRYQDGESPGRKLQALAARGEKASFDAVQSVTPGSPSRGTIKVGKDIIDVQCHIGTYALSAHADEGQLIWRSESPA
jgi:predicted metal-dependent RNase